MNMDALQKHLRTEGALSFQTNQGRFVLRHVPDQEKCYEIVQSRSGAGERISRGVDLSYPLSVVEQQVHGFGKVLGQVLGDEGE